MALDDNTLTDIYQQRKWLIVLRTDCHVAETSKKNGIGIFMESDPFLLPLR